MLRYTYIVCFAVYLYYKPNTSYIYIFSITQYYSSVTCFGYSFDHRQDNPKQECKPCTNNSTKIHNICSYSQTQLSIMSLTFWRRIFFQILAHPVFKMRVIQKPNKVALWNKRHFEETKMEIIQHFKIFSTDICWINIKWGI